MVAPQAANSLLPPVETIMRRDGREGEIADFDG
jgi:hypothetical protein